MAFPDHADGRELVVPFLAKSPNLGLGIIDRRRLINALQVGSDFFAIFPGNKVQTVTHHVHDAELDLCFREHRLDRIRKAGEAVHASHQNVADAVVSELGEHLQPELGALALSDPQTQ